MKENWRAALMMGLLLALISNPAWATVTWIGDGGDPQWNTPENWDSKDLPTKTDDVIINISGNKSILLDTPPVTINSLLISNDRTFKVDLDQDEGNSDSQFTVLSSASIGYNGKGTFSHVSGNVFFNELFIGTGKEAEGYYSMQGGRLETGGEVIGSNGALWGEFTQSGGYHSTTGNIEVGVGTGGALILENDAELAVDGSIFLGNNGGEATLALAGSSKVGIADTLVVGATGGAGSVYQGFQDGPQNPVDSTTSLSVRTLAIADKEGAQGEYHLNSGSLRTENIHIGAAGKFVQTGGTVDVSGEAAATSGYMRIAAVTPAVGQIDIETRGVYEIQGGTLNADSLTNDGRFVYTGGSVTLGSFTQGSDGLLELTLGADFLPIEIQGDAWIDGILQINLMDDFMPETGSMFSIFKASNEMTTFTGKFAEILGPSGWSLLASTVTLDGISNFQVQLTSGPSPVPVPGAAILLGSGLLGLIGLRRRQTS